MSHILLYGLNACKLKYNNANDINKFHPFAKKHKAIQTKVSSHNVGPLITFITLMLPASHKSCPLLFSIVTFTSIHQFVQNLFAVFNVLNFLDMATLHWRFCVQIIRCSSIAASKIFPLLCRRRGRLLMTSHL